MKGNHVLISGGSSGIGLALARLLVAEGVQVHLVGRDERRLEHACAALGDAAHAYVADMSLESDIERLIAEVSARCDGTLDGLVVNAAKYGFINLSKMSSCELDQYFRTNAIGPVLLVNGCLGMLKKGTGKSIVMVSSTLATRPIAGTGAYAATKAALNSLAKSYALELAEDGIRVNAVLPGVVNTPIHEPQTPNDPPREEKMAQLGPMHPIGRVGEAEEVASMIHFLLSDRTGWVTGSLFYVDGGISLV
ncbi:SDR family oxidoreductase [Sulfidibacter corallicola]|uniref:SDR family oxidoreductase n=1 Tax=Sulfidibacter corallicola TaxID=2818388 RepID=A0A8A4TYN9_SULCO|nr:SDR family oxidoreductase [Sulfidibacter corallicola]QTD54062.1 SDR family oxidoreductase [Sulfidibacter corallicola]